MSNTTSIIDENIKQTLGNIIEESTNAILNAPDEVTLTVTLKGEEAASYIFLETVISKGLGYDRDTVANYLLMQGVYHERQRMILARHLSLSETVSV